MGPFPHSAPKAAITAENPAGTDGFEFVEFATTDPTALDGLFRAMGLVPVQEHRHADDRDVGHRQSDQHQLPPRQVQPSFRQPVDGRIQHGPLR